MREREGGDTRAWNASGGTDGEFRLAALVEEAFRAPEDVEPELRELLRGQYERLSRRLDAVRR
jgi:hypothetical protein